MKFINVSKAELCTKHHRKLLTKQNALDRKRFGILATCSLKIAMLFRKIKITEEEN